MARTYATKTVVAAFRHDTSRNLDPVLHSHSVLADTVQGIDAKWGTIANRRLLTSRMLLGTRRGGKVSPHRTDLTEPDKWFLGYTLEFDLAPEGPGPFLDLGRTTVGPAQLTQWNTTDPVRSLPRPSNRFRAA